ncbi:uncharacterized protein [Temnothorax longispinosus]|uniref:uncharacterized protein isoform X4 n=1 Tax=Temnothorax longispinosus TaxID=300112 RepID=UPI003A99F6EA
MSATLHSVVSLWTFRFGRERPRPTRRAPTPSPPVSPPRPARRPERRVPLGRRAPEPLPTILERTRELARSMNAQVIQAEPVGEGPIDSIVIPPRSVNENRTTIVSIPQPLAAGVEAATSEVANRSIRVISETLDEQDAAEAATVQGKLEDLQQARRDFVMSVANVGGHAVKLAEKERPRYIYKVPDIESEMFRVEYGREHPSVVAAREFAQRSMAGISIHADLIDLFPFPRFQDVLEQRSIMRESNEEDKSVEC